MKSSEEKLFSVHSVILMHSLHVLRQESEKMTDSLENNDDFNMFPKMKEADICMIFFSSNLLVFHW